MPLVTGADFGLNFAPGAGKHEVQSLNALTNTIAGIGKQRAEQKQAQQLAQAQAAQKNLMDMSLNLFDVAKSTGDFTQKKTQALKLAQKHKENGGDLSMFDSIIGATNDDEFTTAVTNLGRKALSAKETAEMLVNKLSPQEQFEPVKNEQGQTIAQRNVATGELFDVPDSLIPIDQRQSPYGKYQPGNYSPESWAKFVQTGDPSILEAKPTRLIKVDRGDKWQFLHPVTGDLVTEESKQLGPSQTPEYKGAVQESTSKASAKVKGEGAKKEAEIAYRAFNAGMGEYKNALSQTMTGFVQGRLPAATASQQIADGAKSILLPILKQLFRSAGEGVFTDKDQELLEGMLPTRKDQPEAAQVKLDMVDRVVALKLGLPDPFSSGIVPPGDTDLDNMSLEELEALERQLSQ